jgi:hypothetical protein
MANGFQSDYKQNSNVNSLNFRVYVVTFAVMLTNTHFLDVDNDVDVL